MKVRNKIAEDTWNECRKTKGVASMQRNLFIGIKRASFLSHVSNLYRVRKEGKWTKSSDLRGSFLTLEPCKDVITTEVRERGRESKRQCLCLWN